MGQFTPFSTLKKKKGEAWWSRERGHLKTYTVISFHNLYHQPPQLIPISIHNLYHFEGSASTSTTYTINWHQSGITYTIPEISIAELIPILID